MTLNVTKWHRMALNGTECQQVATNGTDLITPNGTNGTEWHQIEPKCAKNLLNGIKMHQMTQNSIKWNSTNWL